MFEKDLDRARKALQQQLTTTAPYVSFAHISRNAEVHLAYRTFFGAEVAWWLYEERALRTSNPRFDTTDPVLTELFAKLDEAYIRTARFDHEELAATMEAAVKTRLNFLCRPRTTLKWFVFRGEPTKPLHEVLLRLNYLHDYDYLTNGIRSWAALRGADGSPTMEILSIVEFERIVEKIDNDAILDLSQKEFVKMLDPLYEYFAEINPEAPPQTIPTEAAIIFLDDKGAVPISQELERLLYREDMRWLTRTRFLEVIDKVILEIEEQGAGQPTQPANSPQPDTDNPDTPVSAEPAMEHPVVPAPAATMHSAANGTDAAEPTVPAEPYPPAQSEPDDAGTRTSAVHTTSARIERFHREADAYLQQRFLDGLFAGNLTRMDETVAEILEAGLWRDAASRLDLWFARQGVDPNSSLAMDFSHTLHMVYR